MNMWSKHKQTKINDAGFAPIIVSMVIVIVLSLLTLGFVAVINKNQNNALTLQLNNDAYYAAESGINDAVQAINSGYHQAKTSCGPDLAYSYLSNNQVNGPNDIYSCLLINPTPASLQYSSVQFAQPTVAILSTVYPNGAPTKPTILDFFWQPSALAASSPYNFANSNCPSGCSFPPEAQWQYPGVLRLSLTPLSSSGAALGVNDTSTTYTAFLYPSTASNNQKTYNNGVNSGAKSGNIVSGSCANGNSPEACSFVLHIGAANINGYVMALESLYLDSQVTVEAFHGSTQLNFINAQTLIDSTGNDRGVLKRIQVRVAGINDSGFPAFNLAAGNTICKDIQAFPTNLSTSNPGNVTSSCGL